MELDLLKAFVKQEVRRLRNFEVEMLEGGVVLHGQAPSYYAKQLAQHAVMRATDVRILANEIVVP
jgi:osmotically-inducible protein OsmY